MGLFGGMAKAGIARKVFREAQKPTNQRKIKQLFRRITGKTSRRPATR
jgi:hypothetical protein